MSTVRYYMYTVYWNVQAMLTIVDSRMQTSNSRCDQVFELVEDQFWRHSWGHLWPLCLSFDGAFHHESQSSVSFRHPRSILVSVFRCYSRTPRLDFQQTRFWIVVLTRWSPICCLQFYQSLASGSCHPYLLMSRIYRVPSPDRAVVDWLFARRMASTNTPLLWSRWIFRLLTFHKPVGLAQCKARKSRYGHLRRIVHIN